MKDNNDETVLDRWTDGVKISYKVSFTRYFYKPHPLRPLKKIRADILAVGRESERLLNESMGRLEK